MTLLITLYPLGLAVKILELNMTVSDDFRSNSTCYRENFLDLLASKNVTQEMFEDVPSGHYAAQALSGRLGAGSDVAPINKYEATAGSPLFFGSTAPGMHQGMNMAACYPYSDHHQMKEGTNQQQEQLAAPAMASFLQQLNSNASTVGMHASLDYSGIGLDKICQEGRAMEASSFGMRSLPDLSSFSGYRSNAESTSSVRPYLRSSNLSDSSKQEQDIESVRYEMLVIYLTAIHILLQK